MSDFKKVGIVGVGPYISFAIVDELYVNACRQLYQATKIDSSDLQSALGSLSQTMTDVRISFDVSTEVKALGNFSYREDEERRTHDPHSSYYIPPYFAIFGSDRPFIEKRLPLPKSKVGKNVRPKGTHTHRRFYR